MKKALFTIADLQEFWSHKLDDLKTAVENKEFASLEEAYSMTCIKRMMEDLITTTTADGLCQIDLLMPSKGRAPIKILGYAIDEDNHSMDVFVPSFTGETTLREPDARKISTLIEAVAKRLINLGTAGYLTADRDDISSQLFLSELREKKFDLLNIFIITDEIIHNFAFKKQEIFDITVAPQVFDIQRLFKAERGLIREELKVNFEEILPSGSSLDALLVQTPEYNCYMTALPGNVVQKMYNDFKGRLLEANVRSFLTFRTKVNKGIRNTVKSEPENFIAYNNGLVITADNVIYDADPSANRVGIRALVGPQVVNGGQTTVTLSEASSEDLQKVWVPAKIIDLSKLSAKENHEEVIDQMLQKISQSANNQTAVKQSDLASNTAWNKKLEAIANQVATKDGKHWFFERTAKSFETYKRGKTKAELRSISNMYPNSLDKGDVARYIYSWLGEAPTVALGKEKNHTAFALKYVTPKRVEELDANEFRTIIAKAILYRTIRKRVRLLNISSFHEDTTNYLMALIGHSFGESFRFDLIWNAQRLSDELVNNIDRWIPQVVSKLHENMPDGHNPHEWAKKDICWKNLQASLTLETNGDVPEIRTLVS